jgi:hypothetical protein
VFSSGGGGANPYLASATTAAAIRDRIIAVIEALAPGPLASNPYIGSRNEYGADFEDWARSNPDGAFRRFQVRDTGEQAPPEVSNTNLEWRSVTFEIVVAYPQSHRTGPQNALDRDDIMSADQHQIEQAIGVNGYANFIDPSPNACWVSGSTDRDISDPVDFLVIKQTMGFWRAMT